MDQILNAQYEQIEKLAYQLREERGRPFGIARRRLVPR
jgi:hypothetical protein